jgi:glycosyltransferase involved in cell wall biosynthesis
MSEKAKTLQIITLSEWGGAQQVCYDLATRLHGDEFTVEVACAPGGPLVEKLKKSGIKVHQINSLKRDFSPIQDLKCLFQLYSLIRRGKYQIVHCHSTKAGILGRIAAWLARVPRIYFTVHGWGFYNEQEYGWAQRILILAERLCARFSTKIICVSENDLKQGLARKIARAGKFTLIRNGVAMENLNRTGSLRREINATDEEVVFGMVARLHYPKDPILYLKAAKMVLESNGGCHFVLIGDGSLYDECLEFVSKSGLESRVHVLGFRKNARFLYSDFDVFVLSSLFEGLPLTVIEAMFAGLPVVASNVGGIPELVSDGRNGFLTIPGSPEDLAQKMLLLAKDDYLRRKMGGESSIIAKSQFALETMISQYRDLYLS